MSLKQMLIGKSEKDQLFQKIIYDLFPNKGSFYTLSGKVPFSSDYAIVVPYELSNPYVATVIGTAFDYLARVIVARAICKNKQSAYIGLTAGNGLTFLKGKIDSTLYSKIAKKYICNLSIFMEFVHSDYSKVENITDQCKSKEELNAFLEFLNKASKHTYSYNVRIDELCCAASFFARLEHIARSGMLPENINMSLLSKPETEVISDLEKMSSVFSDVFIQSGIVSADSIVIFNPTFGSIISMCVQGADADIYIDGVIYDFKTTKNCGYVKKDIAQILSYYLLYLASIAIGDPYASLSEFVVDRIALYKARSGEVEYLNIDALGKDKVLNALKSLLSIFGLEMNQKFYSIFDKYLYTEKR